MLWALFRHSHVVFNILNSMIFNRSTQKPSLLDFLLALVIHKLLLKIKVLLLKNKNLLLNFFIVLLNSKKSLQFVLFDLKTFIFFK